MLGVKTRTPVGVKQEFVTGNAKHEILVSTGQGILQFIQMNMPNNKKVHESEKYASLVKLVDEEDSQGILDIIHDMNRVYGYDNHEKCAYRMKVAGSAGGRMSLNREHISEFDTMAIMTAVAEMKAEF